MDLVQQLPRKFFMRYQSLNKLTSVIFTHISTFQPKLPSRPQGNSEILPSFMSLWVGEINSD